MPRRQTLALLLLTTASPVLFATETFTVDKTHSDASFQIRHFTSKVRGGFTDFEGTIQADPAKPQMSSVVFTIKSASINTHNADRDKHLQSPDFFDAARCPDIRFQSSKITPAGEDKYDVTGTLTMRCVSKEVTIPVIYSGTVADPWGNDRAGFEITTKLNRKDYGINWNRALDAGGFVLADDVVVTINLEAVRKKAAPPAGSK